MTGLTDRIRKLLSEMDAKQHAMLDIHFFLAEIDGVDASAMGQALREIAKSDDAPLERFGMFFDDEGEHAIEGEEFSEYEETGVLVHPESGEIVDPGDMVIYYAVVDPAPRVTGPA